MNGMRAQTKQSSSRKWVAMLVAVIVLCVVVAYLFFWRTAGASNAVGASVSVLKRDKALNALLNSNSSLALDTKMVPLQSPPTDSPAWKTILTNLVTLLKGGKVDVCGLSDFDAALYVAGDAEVGTTAVNSTLAQLTGKLIGSDKPAERLQGLYMQAHLDQWALDISETGKYRICRGDFECIGKLPNSNSPTEMPTQIRTAAAPLVKLALESRDPSTIAAAIYACAGTRDGACGSISIADWASVEPDNAAVWLMMADAASYAKDTVGRDAALRRAVAAPGYDVRALSLASTLESDLVKAQSPLVRYHIGNELASSAITALPLPIHAAARYCLHETNKDADHDAVCETLANKLSQQDEGLIGLSIAIAIGKKLGWDETRLQPLRDEKAVGLGRMNDAFPSGNIFSCKQLAQNNLLAQNMLAKSERQIGREIVANSGKSLAELAKEYRVTYPSLGK